MPSFLQFEPLPSEEPGVPDFVVRVPSSRIRGDQMPIPGVTLFKDFPFGVWSRSNEEWTKNYVYVFENMGGAARDPDGSLLWEFYFTKNRGDDLFRQPITFRTDNTTRPHPWHDVLLRMGFLEDATQPINVSIGGQIVEIPRLFDRFWKIPGGVYASKMKVEVFLNHQAFPEDMFLLDVPVPSVVSWNMRNVRGSLNCLHPRVRFVETQLSATVLPNAGTIDHPLIMSGFQDFPATNHQTWLPHVCDEDVSQVRGVRRLVRTTVTPPGVKLIRNSV